MPSKQGPRTWSRCTNLQHPRFSLPQLLATHPINHAVQLILPCNTPPTNPNDSCPPLPNPPSDLCSDSCLALGPLGDIVHELVERDAWPHAEGASGAVAVAVGPQLDTTGGISISQIGRLQLSVTSATYQQLGLLGKHSKAEPGQRYNIEVDLTSKGCRPGQPYHKRVVERLNQVLGSCCLAVAVPGAGGPAGGTAAAVQAWQPGQLQQQPAQLLAPHPEPSPAAEQPGAGPLPSAGAASEAGAQPLPVTAAAAAAGAAVLLQGLPAGSVRPLPTRRRSWEVTGVTLPTLTRRTVMGGSPAGAVHGDQVQGVAEVLQHAGVHGLQHAGVHGQHEAMQENMQSEQDDGLQGQAAMQVDSSSVGPTQNHPQQGTTLEAIQQPQQGTTGQAADPGSLTHITAMDVDDDIASGAADTGPGPPATAMVAAGSAAPAGAAAAVVTSAAAVGPAILAAVAAAGPVPPAVAAAAASCCVAELQQWLGALSCGFPGAAVNALLPQQLASQPTQPRASEGSVRVTEWTGLLHNEAVQQLVLHAAQQVRSGACAWAAVGVWGWEDSPLAWEGMEHSAAHTVGLAGDTTSHYSLILMPNDDLVVINALGVADFGLPKPNECKGASPCKSVIRGGVVEGMRIAASSGGRGQVRLPIHFQAKSALEGSLSGLVASSMHLWLPPGVHPEPRR